MGFNSGENMDNVLLGRSALRQHRLWNIPEPFIASLFESEELQELCNRELSPATAMTRFERLATISAKKAIEESGIDPSSPRVIFIISTTKGNVELLGETQLEIPQERITPAISAKVIAGYFGNPNTPVVVSNACTSGACAQLRILRLRSRYRSRGTVQVHNFGLSILQGTFTRRMPSIRQGTPGIKCR